MESERGFAGVRFDMVAGRLVLGVYEVAVEAVVVRSFDLIPVVRWYWVVVEKTE